MNDIVKKEDTAVVAHTAITPMEMISQAIEKGVDVDQLGKLFDLQERWEKNNAAKAYVEAMLEFKKTAPDLEKLSKADFGDGKAKYNWSKLDYILDKLKPVMNECGFSTSWDSEPVGANTKVTCVVTHVGGHSETSSVEGPADKSGGKSSLQAIGSGQSYLQRYSLLAALGMTTKEQDTDGIIIGNIDDDELKEITNKIETHKLDKVAFCKALGVTSISEIQAKDLVRANRMVNKKITQLKGAEK